MQAFISQKCINNIYLLSGIETLGARTDQNNRPLHTLCIVPQCTLIDLRVHCCGVCSDNVEIRKLHANS